MKNNKSKRLATLMIILMLSMSTTVFAEVLIPINPKDSTEIQECITAASKANKILGSTDSSSSLILRAKKDITLDDGTTATEVTVLSYESNILKFDDLSFRRANHKEVTKAMTAFIDSLKESSVSNDTQQYIMTQLQDSNTDVAAILIPLIADSLEADLFIGYTWLYPFLKVLRVIFGIGAILIILFLLVSTTVDLCYIGLPIWRNTLAEKNGKTTEKAFLVSYDAHQTVVDVERNVGDGEYKNIYLLYLRRRSVTYIILAICLLYLILGEFSGVISGMLYLGNGAVS